MGRPEIDMAQVDADGVGKGGEEVSRRGPDGMTRDQYMAVDSRG